MLWRALLWRPRVVRASFSSLSPSRASEALRSLPGARELLLTLERAPCLNCGVAPPVAAHRVACRECAEHLESERGELLGQFRSIVEDLEFAASTDARQLFSRVLTPSRRRATNDDTQTTSWADYLRLYASATGSTTTTETRLLSDERAVRLASSAFSYVLTLSAFLPQLLPPVNAINSTDTEDDDEREIALHVVGARAEAMMPDYLWDEVAFFHPQRRAFEITLVGDHVPVSRRVRSARGLPLQVEAVRGLYHDAELPSSRDPDALVLFNPGIGHPLLKDRWRPTIQTMLESGKPLLLTSFSAADQERDVAVLNQLAESSLSGRRLDFLVGPRQNPFRSLKYQVNDDGGSIALIQTNSHVMAVHLSD